MQWGSIPRVLSRASTMRQTWVGLQLWAVPAAQLWVSQGALMFLWGLVLSQRHCCAHKLPALAAHKGHSLAGQGTLERTEFSLQDWIKLPVHHDTSGWHMEGVRALSPSGDLGRRSSLGSLHMGGNDSTKFKCLSNPKTSGLNKFRIPTHVYFRLQCFIFHRTWAEQPFTQKLKNTSIWNWHWVQVNGMIKMNEWNQTQIYSLFVQAKCNSVPSNLMRFVQRVITSQLIRNKTHNIPNLTHHFN